MCSFVCVSCIPPKESAVVCKYSCPSMTLCPPLSLSSTGRPESNLGVFHMGISLQDSSHTKGGQAVYSLSLRMAGRGILDLLFIYHCSGFLPSIALLQGIGEHALSSFD